MSSPQALCLGWRGLETEKDDQGQADKHQLESGLERDHGDGMYTKDALVGLRW